MPIRRGIIASILAMCIVACASFENDSVTAAGASVESATGSFTRLDAGFVHYEQAGDTAARTVLLVHGFSVPFYVWDRTVSALHEAGFRTLRFDLYGRGWSDRPRVRYDLDLFVSQIDQLLEELDITVPIDIIALSYGGPISATFTSANSSRVRRVCIVGPQMARVRNEDIFPMNVPGLGELVMHLYLVPFGLPELQLGDFAQPERFPDWPVRYREPMRIPGFGRAILSSTRYLPKIDATAAYERLVETGKPVLFIWGEQDRNISLEDVEKVAAMSPDIELHQISGAGHLVHYEFAEIVNPLITEFLLRE